jgi:hypothetical protein
LKPFIVVTVRSIAVTADDLLDVAVGAGPVLGSDHEPDFQHVVMVARASPTSCVPPSWSSSPSSRREFIPVEAREISEDCEAVVGFLDGDADVPVGTVPRSGCLSVDIGGLGALDGGVAPT